MLTLIGFLAATLTTVSFVPQVIKIWKTNDTEAISLEMFLLFSLGVIVWLIYGILRNDIVIILANVITLSMSLYILSKKIFSK
jgi:MtN3 and saliva related transmembrane protein